MLNKSLVSSRDIKRDQHASAVDQHSLIIEARRKVKFLIETLEERLANTLPLFLTYANGRQKDNEENIISTVFYPARHIGVLC